MIFVDMSCGMDIDIQRVPVRLAQDILPAVLRQPDRNIP
ncbi:hypothetical protein LHK_02250 [Laribacter hongkongensis HLHK9]|uniref:Uncharacterized protein n=2 Tax=Laribacter hongkongensis TaxID=168471 RepID=C1DAB9_LARHH|nr:hypothetical protein LHK_02250 [Laribacter hongkongensis HLHK9]ASJ25152.1 hypothetical protein LHGZ1_2321 [Laribacter hongkongensis]